MGSLSGCVEKIGMPKQDAGYVRELVNGYRADGYKAQRATRLGANDYLNELIEEKQEILGQVESAGVPRETNNFEKRTDEPIIESQAAKETGDNVVKKGAGKIEDFGEKIGGARKDYATKLSDAEKLDITTEPFAKTWPEPNYQSLIDSGVDSWVVSFVRAARDSVPPKPRKSWQVKGWAEKLSIIRDVANKLLTGEASGKRAQELLNTDVYKHLKKELEGSISLYQALGHEKSLNGIKLSEVSYSFFKGQKFDPPKVIWSVERKAKGRFNMPDMLATGDTKESAIAAFKKVYDKLGETKEKIIRFDIFSTVNGEKQYFIGKKAGKNIIRLKFFDDAKEARKYLQENQKELESLLSKHKEIPSERKENNSPRVGIDHRGGADVTPEQFSEAFGFRGVEFGNYVENDKRQNDLNEAYDALMDMAGVLNIPAKAISLNGELGLAFGARGIGGKDATSAHYERDKVVINLTKKSGAGSLAHEWFHALDNYFSRSRSKKEDFLTERPYQLGKQDPVRQIMIDAFKAISKAVNNVTLLSRARKLDSKKTKDYWSTGREMAARSFESYIIAKLQDQNVSNDYLANIVSKEYWDASAALGLELEGTYPYPDANELPAIRETFDNFFNVIEHKETDKGIALFSKTKVQPWYFSALKRAAENLKQEKGSADQFLNMLKNTQGVKAEELEWTGLEEYLNAKQSENLNVTKQEIVDYLSANGVQVEEVSKGGGVMPDGWYVEKVNSDEMGYMDFQYYLYDSDDEVRGGGNTREEAIADAKDSDYFDTKFHQYQTPGGENYREVLLTLPAKKTNRSDFKIVKEGGRYSVYMKGREESLAWLPTKQMAEEYISGVINRGDGASNFISPHFGEPNILAHIRLNDRTDADGKNTLFVEEIQSDWIQSHRKARKSVLVKLNAEIKKLESEGRLKVKCP